MKALRTAYLLPALADFYLAAITVLRTAGVNDASVVPRLQFAGVAFAWGVMLLLAMARPIDRAWVLWPTGLAVASVAGAICYGYWVGVVGLLPAMAAALTAIIIFAFGYAGLRFAYRADADTKPEVRP